MQIESIRAQHTDTAGCGIQRAIKAPRYNRIQQVTARKLHSIQRDKTGYLLNYTLSRSKRARVFIHLRTRPRTVVPMAAAVYTTKN